MKSMNSSPCGMKGQRICVLIVEQSAKDREMMGRFLAAWNFEPLAVANAGEAMDLAGGQAAAIAIISDPERGSEGIELVRALRQASPGLETILLAEDNSAKYATEAFRAGVYDCLKRPVDFRQLSRDLNTLREAVQRRMDRKVWEAASGTETLFEGMVGRSAPMQAVFASIRRIAADDSPVLITGLIGTGKELAARALHALSERSSRPLVIYRCCGVSEALAAMELFGESAYTSHGQRGRAVSEPEENGIEILNAARGGTLFLDEIGDLPASIQTRLATLLRDGRMDNSKVHSAKTGTVRLLAATRLNLADQAGRGQFSGELYRFLSRNVIHLPSLAERQEDIPLLCKHFQEKFNQEFGKTSCGYSPAAERALLSYLWPGNVRELENVIGRACLLADQDWIELSDLSIAAPLSAIGWPERHSDWAGESRAVMPERESQKARRSPRSSTQVGPGAGAER